ncbi:MAG: response regulator [Candidatus Omnitrophica bacterium]|nr:response regulator [Candidatus Omnitrophota bacterium]
MKKQILVVDDDRGAVALLENRLTDLGFEVLKAFDGQEGLALVKKTPPDLIILDQMMPKMDGVRVCALLKADRRFAKIPVIIFTASAEKVDQKMSEQAGADLFLTKPYNIPVLLQNIQRMLGA